MIEDSAGGRGRAEELSASRRCTRWDQPTWKRTPTVDLSAFCPALELEGVIFTILSFLPLHKIFELRLVCKAWNTLLRSPAFLRAWSRAPHQGWLVMVSNGHPVLRELIVHDPATDRWMSLQPLLDSFPSAALDILGGYNLCNVINPFFYPEQSCLSQFGVAAGVPGLVCFLTSPIDLDFTAPHVQERDVVDRVYNHQIFSLLVVNLLTGSHRNLPQSPRHSVELASWYKRDHSSMLVSMQPLPNNGYRVFLQSPRAFYPGPIEIYDSSTGRWKVGSPCECPSDAKIGSAADLERADRLQFLPCSRVVYAYSADLDEWSLALAQFPRSPDGEDGTCEVSYKNRYTLFRYRGRVFLVYVRQRVGSVLRGFTVWKLCMRHSSPLVAGTPVADWVEVTRTPRHLWRSCGSLEEGVLDSEAKVISCGSLICMTAVLYTDSDYGGTYYPPLVYDLDRNAWHQLPFLTREAMTSLLPLLCSPASLLQLN